MKKILSFLLLVILSQSFGYAQPVNEIKTPDPKTAFLRSLVIPGWGHHYVNKSNWSRGKYHLGIEVTLVLSFLGFNIHSNNLQQNWYSYARSEAGINIKGRNRSLQLAVGDFDNLASYNDFQARLRNWNQFIVDTPKNRWSWDNEAERARYNDLRNRFENIDQQLPALIGLMVVNRVVSAISAYNRARKISTKSSSTSFYFSPSHQTSAIVANLKVSF